MNASTLHIFNGDATASIARRAGIEGEYLPWREALIDGPAPGGLSPEEWMRVRAEHLSRAYGLPVEECLESLRIQQQVLERSNEFSEIILWFEFDLFCQANLLYLLDYFYRENPDCRVSLICIGEFPGISDFRGIGQLLPAQLLRLMEQRVLLTPEHLALGARGWSAYTSSDPRTIEALLDEETALLPFLASALLSHLMRFPALRNGLGRIEHLALEQIADEARPFPQIFQRFSMRAPEYGLGDLQLLNRLKQMLKQRLVTVVLDREMMSAPDSADYSTVSFTATDDGLRILSGETDRVSLVGIDEWIGGVRLTMEGPQWRWDDAAGVIVEMDAIA